MKFLSIISILVSSILFTDVKQEIIPKTISASKLEPCPNSPNCVSTQALKKSKKMKPLEFTGNADSALEQLLLLMGSYTNTKLIERNENYMHFEFKTKIGSFIDDVEFLIDEDAKLIHFRSASRTGYGDFGKNKRRMKMISKDWENKL